VLVLQFVRCTRCTRLSCQHTCATCTASAANTKALHTLLFDRDCQKQHTDTNWQSNALLLPVTYMTAHCAPLCYISNDEHTKLNIHTQYTAHTPKLILKSSLRPTSVGSGMYTRFSNRRLSASSRSQGVLVAASTITVLVAGGVGESPSACSNGF
jgi:hypothetical protein